MITVPVNASKKYDILIGRELLPRQAALLERLQAARRP